MSAGEVIEFPVEYRTRTIECYIGSEKLAEELAVSRRLIEGYVAEGVPRYRMGASSRRSFRLSEVKEWLADREEAKAAGAWVSKARGPNQFTGLDADYAKLLRRDPCSYCGGRAGGIDHITPVRLGGLDNWDNLTACCRACNSSKLARPLLVFLAERKA